MNADEKIRKLQEFVEDNYKAKLLEAVSSGKKFFVVDFSELSKFDPSLAEEFLNEPEESLKAVEMACKQIDLPTDIPNESAKIKVRLTNIPDFQKIMIRNIRSEHIGKLLFIEGLVRQKSDVRPQVVSSRFECPSCGQVISVLQLDQNFKEPTKCSCGRKGKFSLLSKELVDAQSIVLEETPETLEGGEQPKRMNIFLKEDLVSPISDKRTNPGSKVKVVGELKEVPMILKSGGKSTRFDLLIEANNIEAVEEDFFDIKISKEEEQQILDLSNDPKIYDKLIESIAPSIYGYERVKEALVLQMMGGVMKKRKDEVTTRGDIHILLVGDPGAGKSQILKRISRIAPKGRYVSGKGASGAGMTAAVVRDEFLGGWSLEAGALVLANNGVCCIDEMDKMGNEDREALHEALEQQSYHPESEIMLSDGSTHKIGIFVDSLLEKNSDKKIIGRNCEILPVDDVEVLSTDFRKVYPIKINRVSRHTAPDYFIEIGFSNGRKITVTPEHPVYLFKGKPTEVPAEEVKVNDLSFAVRKMPVKSTSSVPAKLSRLLGYIASEGHSYYNEKHSYAEVGISNTDKKITDECSLLFEDLFKVKPNINVQKKEKRKKATKDLITVRIPSIKAYSFLKNEFPELTEKANRKRVPNRIKTSSAESKKEFLIAAFKGDGFIDSERFGFSTSSYGMAKDLQDLLLNLNILSYIATEKRGEKEYYKVVLSSTESMELFRKEIVEKDDKRLERIDFFCKRSSNKMNFRDPVPPVIIKRIDMLLRKLRLNTGYFNKILENGQNCNRNTAIMHLERVKSKIGECAESLEFSSIRNIRKMSSIQVAEIAREMNVSPSMLYYIEDKNHLSSHSILLEKTKSLALGKIASIEKELDELLSIVKNDLKLVTVKSVRRIENMDVKWVYDVTVEPTKTFVSEGLVLHNTLSISKANIHATLLTRTTVLAAANPKFGRFDPYGVLAEQIDMPPTLINRFDLIFPIKDMPDPVRDERMAKHILFLHQTPESMESEMPTMLLKKYIAYARQRVFPVLTEGALNEIKDFYVKMRGLGTEERGFGNEKAVRAIPISARQLEALIRLAEASARVRLSEKVTRKDSRRAIELITYCLLQVGLDKETGRIDIDRISTGIPASQRDRIYTVKEIIMELENKIGKTIPIDDIIRASLERGIAESDVEEIMERLKRSGDVYEPRSGFFSRM